MTSPHSSSGTPCLQVIDPPSDAGRGMIPEWHAIAIGRLIWPYLHNPVRVGSSGLDWCALPLCLRPHFTTWMPGPAILPVLVELTATDSESPCDYPCEPRTLPPLTNRSLTPLQA